MADRIDPSQYPDAVDFTGGEFDESLSITDFPVNTEPSIDTPESVDFTNYRGPSDIPDIMRAYPELFNTRPASKTEAVIVYRNFPSGGGAVISGPGVFKGYSVVESSDVAAAVVKVRLRDGMDTSGNILAVFSLTTSASRQDMFSDGIQFNNGLYVEIYGTGTGAIEGTLYTEKIVTR